MDFLKRAGKKIPFMVSTADDDARAETEKISSGFPERRPDFSGEQTSSARRFWFRAFGFAALAVFALFAVLVLAIYLRTGIARPVVAFGPLPVAGGATDFGADEAPVFHFNLDQLSVPAPAAQDISPKTGSLALISAPWPDLFRFGANFVTWFRIGLASLWNKADAQTVNAHNPTVENPVIAEIDDFGSRATGFQPVIADVNNQVSVSVPEPSAPFRPGRYVLKLWILRNGAVYETETDFTWGVLAVNFNKSIYDLNDVAHIGLGVLADDGHTVCDAMISMTITGPDGTNHSFNTDDGTIVRNTTCGPQTVTNNPDYAATLPVSAVGSYQVSVTAQIPGGSARTLTDRFEAQNPPLFDVERSGPTRIFPPPPTS